MIKNKNKEINVVIFDCFGVLVQGTLDRFREKYLTEKTDEERNEFSDLSHASDSGLISYDEFSRGAAKLAGISVEDANKLFHDTPKNTALFEFIREKLRPAGYKIGLLSNIGQGRIAGVLSDEDLEVFDEKVLSCDVHMRKPDAEIYEFAAEKFDVEPKNCVFIDDFQENVLGAENVGMQGIVYENFAEFREKLTKILGNEEL